MLSDTMKTFTVYFGRFSDNEKSVFVDIFHRRFKTLDLVVFNAGQKYAPFGFRIHTFAVDKGNPALSITDNKIGDFIRFCCYNVT